MPIVQFKMSGRREFAETLVAGKFFCRDVKSMLVLVTGRLYRQLLAMSAKWFDRPVEPINGWLSVAD